MLESETAFRLVQVIPSGEVITRLPVPELDTATNNSAPAGPPYVTEFHEILKGTGRLVHVIPSGEVITRSPVPELDTATNN